MYDQQVRTGALSLEVMLLETKTRTVNGQPCVYDLAVSKGMHPQYYISLTLMQERCIACIGSSQALALLLFSTLVSGLVTPCSLSDVLCELHCG